MNPELGRFRIIHFGTHTILNDRHPDMSSLVLSLIDENGKPQSGTSGCEICTTFEFP
jgi:CHAT domain-containing protein